MLKLKYMITKYILMLLVLGVLRANCQRKVNKSYFNLF